MMVRRSAIFAFACLFLFYGLLASQTQTHKERADLLVAGGTVVTMDALHAIIDDGAVVVTGDAIVAVGPRSEVAARYAPTQTIDAKGKLVLP